MALNAKLDNVRLLVDHFSECVDFYRDVLGFDIPAGDHFPYVSFSAGDSVIALFDRTMMQEALGESHAADGVAADRAALIFELASVDEAYAALSDRGVRFLAGPTDRDAWGIRTAHLRDPSGTLIELYTPLARGAAPA